MATVTRWKLIDYFDVWFNEEDGYWVNDQTEVFDDLNIVGDPDNRELFDYLKDVVGYFGPQAEFEKMNFDGDDYYIEISTEDDRGYWLPICRLERVV